MRVENVSALTILLFLAFPMQGQSCHEANSEFVAMADDPGFVESHELPAEDMRTNDGTWIQFEAGDLPARGYEMKSSEETNKWILVFHEWWGLNDNIKREVEEWSERLNVNVLAIDLYDGKIGQTRAAAGELMQNADPERIKTIIRGAFNYIGEDAEIGTIGWCFGGGWSLQAAIEGQDRVRACVMYYGMPEKDHERLQSLEAPVLGIFASQDQWINGEVVDSFNEDMSEVEKELSVQVYDADHAFANPSNENVYDEEAARDAMNKATAFFEEHLL